MMYLNLAQAFVAGQFLLNAGACLAYLYQRKWPLAMLYACWACASIGLIWVDKWKESP